MLDRYLDALAAHQNCAAVSNPYAGAPGEVRLRRLRAYLTQACAYGASLALIGEAPGYRGCAATGIPFTSRQVLATDLGRWSLFGPAYRAGEALDAPWAEATASVVWRHVPRLLAAPPLVANAFPFHPHPADRPTANRPLTAAELAAGAGYLRLFFDALPGAVPVAVGRQAERALRLLGATPAAVLRHPSHGGAAAFASGLARLAAGVL